MTCSVTLEYLFSFNLFGSFIRKADFMLVRVTYPLWISILSITIYYHSVNQSYFILLLAILPPEAIICDLSNTEYIS